MPTLVGIACIKTTTIAYGVPPVAHNPETVQRDMQAAQPVQPLKTVAKPLP